MYPIVDFAAGALLLALGRRLFWLFVAIAGFYVGVEFVRVLLAEQPSWLMWAVGIGAGLLGALLAMLFQRVGFALGGFYAGGYAALIIAERFAPGAVGTVAFIIGGVVGALLAAWVMDWAIIVLSCTVGAALIVASLRLEGLVSLLVYAALVAIGIATQVWLMNPNVRASGKDRELRE
jgi:hypothetical protein